MRVLVLFACLLAACATTPPSPFFGDEKYLRFGVDKNTEADALVKVYADRGERLARRIDGHDFTALGFVDRAGRATRTRVITVRGIELALDHVAATPLQPSLQYALLAAPIPDTQDADGDGFEELFVDRRSAREHCVLVFRVRDVGTVERVPVSIHAFGRWLCPSEVRDIDGDGRAELLVSVAFDEFEGEPSVRFPLWASGHHFERLGNPEAAERFYAHEQLEREAELRDARAQLDEPNMYRLAVELAALAYLRAEQPSEQLAAFDGALLGLVLTPAQQASIQHARERIYRGWNASDPEQDPGADATGALAPRKAS